MSEHELPELGKVHPEFFKRVIYPKLGAHDPALIVRPQHGVDFGVIDLGEQVMVLSTDPFYIAKELGMEKAAWFAVHIIASDVAVSGIPPKYLSIDLNLPPEMTEDELERMWTAVDAECKALGIAVVTGHTARYAGCAYPMVGGATMFGVGAKEKLIAPQAQVGDHVVVSKGPAVETTGLMSAYFPKYLEDAHGAAFVKEAQDVYYQMSTVKDAQVAASVGGVTAMHDATECGVYGGLFEIASHSRVGMNLRIEDIVLQDVIAKTCAVYDIDPYKAISEGTLLATVRPEKAHAVVAALESEGIPASVCGEVTPESEGMHIIENGQKRPLEHPKVDPFWIKFEEYLKK